VMKMMCLDASILKSDFNYKIARKIRVWTGRGEILWKALKMSESFSEIKLDLERLRHLKAS
jgi:hypothetical protein